MDRYQLIWTASGVGTSEPVLVDANIEKRDGGPYVLFADAAARLAEAAALLKEVEWHADVTVGSGIACPCCWGLKEEGHEGTCALQAFLLNIEWQGMQG